MDNYKIKYLISFFSISLCLIVKGQTDNSIGSWNGLGLKWELNDKFSFFTESRLRGYGFYDKFYYYEITFRACYTINDIFSVSAGTGKHETFPTEGNFVRPVETSEIRTYEEIMGKNSFSRFFFDQRIRIEQRYTNNGYENRFRYRFSCSVPLNNAEIVPKTIFLSTWDELFINVPKFHLDLNRFFAGVNYKLNYVTLQSGCVNQISFKDTGKTVKNFFLISMLFEIRNKKQVHAPYIN